MRTLDRNKRTLRFWVSSNRRSASVFLLLLPPTAGEFRPLPDGDPILRSSSFNKSSLICSRSRSFSLSGFDFDFDFFFLISKQLITNKWRVKSSLLNYTTLDYTTLEFERATRAYIVLRHEKRWERMTSHQKTVANRGFTDEALCGY